ncbi:Uncharacterised protein [uncultured archaeon]|nr:Uncharacterised protein [uncultured archaeon]
MIELTPDVNDTYVYDPVMLGSMTIYHLVNVGLPTFAFSSEGDKIIQVFLIHNSNGRIESKLDTVPFFTVYPNITRLQATTEIDTIKQIRLHNITDADIVGLSYVGIGLAFIVIGSDILLRIFLEPYTEKMKNDGEKYQKYSTGWFRAKNYRQ